MPATLGTAATAGELCLDLAGTLRADYVVRDDTVQFEMPLRAGIPLSGIRRSRNGACRKNQYDESRLSLPRDVTNL